MSGLTGGSAFVLQKEGVNRKPQSTTESDAMPYDEVMDKFKKGKLHSGSDEGPKVTDQDQAVAIMLSEKRKAMAGKKEYQSKKKPKGIAAHMREAAEK